MSLALRDVAPVEEHLAGRGATWAIPEQISFGLRRHQIALRVFLLVHPPFMPEKDALIGCRKMNHTQQIEPRSTCGHCGI